MKRRYLPIGAVAALASSSVPNIARASSHREAPAIAFDPAADNTDLWAWVNAGAHDKLYIVASYNPLEEPAGGPNFNEFSDDVLYEIHIARGNKSLERRRHLPDRSSRSTAIPERRSGGPEGAARRRQGVLRAALRPHADLLGSPHRQQGRQDHTTVSARASRSRR